MKKITGNYLFILELGIYAALLDAIFRAYQGMRFISPRAVIFSFLYGVIFAIPTLLLKKKKTKIIYLTIVCLVLVLLPFTQLMHYQFFSEFYSFNKLSNIKELFVVKGEIAKAFSYKYLLIFIPYIALLITFKWIVNDSNKRDPLVFTIGCLLIALSFVGIKATFNDLMEDKTQVYLTDSYLYETVFNKTKALERFGVYVYSERDLSRIIEHKVKPFDEKEVASIQEYFDNHQRELKTNEKTGIFKGKNVVLVLVESFNTWGINEDVTPNLYKMKNSGYYFENYYSPTFPSSTIDAEFAINTGLYPSLDFGNTAYEFSSNSYPNSLANLFKNAGYNTVSFHNSIGSFYNRYQFHEALGYDKFYDADALGIEVPENFGYNWANDYDLFDKSADILINNYADSNFFSYLITVSTHTPYDDNRTGLKEQFDYVSKYIDASDDVKYYLAAAKDLDDGVGQMIDKFEKAGIIDDTVFIFFGDHYSYGMYHEIIWDYYSDYSWDFHRIHNVPLLIWTPNMEDNEIVSDYASQFEVYPTILNLFGMDYNPTYVAGNDIFNHEENLIIYGKRTSWQDSNVIYEDDKIFEKLNDSDLSYVASKNAEIINKLDIYQKVLQQDYFKTKVYEENK